MAAGRCCTSAPQGGGGGGQRRQPGPGCSPVPGPYVPDRRASAAATAASRPACAEWASCPSVAYARNVSHAAYQECRVSTVRRAPRIRSVAAATARAGPRRRSVRVRGRRRLAPRAAPAPGRAGPVVHQLDRQTRPSRQAAAIAAPDRRARSRTQRGPGRHRCRIGAGSGPRRAGMTAARATENTLPYALANAGPSMRAASVTR